MQCPHHFSLMWKKIYRGWTTKYSPKLSYLRWNGNFTSTTSSRKVSLWMPLAGDTTSIWNWISCPPWHQALPMQLTRKSTGAGHSHPKANLSPWGINSCKQESGPTQCCAGHRGHGLDSTHNQLGLHFFFGRHLAEANLFRQALWLFIKRQLSQTSEWEVRRETC